MNPDASFALRCSVANMRAAGRVDEKALEGVRRFLDSCDVCVSHWALYVVASRLTATLQSSSFQCSSLEVAAVALLWWGDI
jgi:hypothetical protein